jgi:hypothetical protein
MVHHFTGQKTGKAGLNGETYKGIGRIDMEYLQEASKEGAEQSMVERKPFVSDSGAMILGITFS